MRLLPLVLLLVAPILAGCASEDAPPEVTPPTASTPAPTPAPEPVALQVRTSGAYPVNPGYDPATLSVPAGAQVTVTFTNAETAPLARHDWVVEGVDGAKTDVIAPGDTTEVTFTAPAPGEYVYFCSVGDHRARGMAGTLTVA